MLKKILTFVTANAYFGPIIDWHFLNHNYHYMKKLLLLTGMIFLFYSCNTKKQVAVALNSGDYNEAIKTSVYKLQRDKFKKGNRDYIFMLRDAFHKANERDLVNIRSWKRTANPEWYKKIYETYTGMQARQNKLKPLMPLQVDGKNIQFQFLELGEEIALSRDKLSSHLYSRAQALLKDGQKSEARQAYRDLSYLNRINPNYSNTQDLLKRAHLKGKDYILVSVNNEAEVVMPAALEEELLDISFYEIQHLWSEYHAEALEDLDYDYAVELNIRDIMVSPEQLREREYIRTREVVDGWKYQLDANGNVAKDSLGNDIKVDRIVEVNCKVLESIQKKSSRVMGELVFMDLSSGTTLNSFPIESRFLFENLYAKINGDERALTKEDLQLIKNRELPFPSDEQMVYDTGEDLKLQLKHILKKHSITP